MRAEARHGHARGRWFALLAAILVLWFGFLELRGLYFPDEGRYAEIPREMLASGDWVTPRLSGFPYFEKPPLQYWVTASVFAVAGEDEWTTRLWPALAGLLAVLAVMLTARRLFGKRAGWMAAAVMASSWGFFLATQFVTLDMSLTAFMTGALCAFAIAQDGRTDAPGRRRFMLLAWAACALAILTKGPVAVVLPLLAVGAYVAITRDLSLLRRLHCGAGLAVAAAIAAPWFVLAELRNPGFAEFFFIHEHLHRYTQPGHRRPGPWWYFVPIAIAFLMPWLPAIIATLARRESATPVVAPPGIDVRRFAWCSAAVIFVFFSLSSSKLPAYVMPAMGAVMLAVAAPLARNFAAAVRVTAWTLVACGVAAALLALPVADLITIPLVREEYVDSTEWVIAGALVLVVAGALALGLLRARRRLPALAAVVVASMVACQIGGVLAYNVDSYFSAERLVEQVIASERATRPFRPEVAFYSVDMFDGTVAFYLGRTLTVVRDQGELAWGIAAAPANFVADFAEFERRWRAHGDAYAIMGVPTYDGLAGTGLPMRVVGRDGRRVVVARR
ncbi:MAG: glycosyltransferase family 39 protein [Burkholderiales bacterium]